jgi:hypothetical protein
MFTIVSSDHRFWFKYRVGYILIPIIHLLLIALPYVLTIVVSQITLNIIPITKQCHSWAIFLLLVGLLADLIFTPLTIKMTSLYYGDFINIPINMINAQDLAWIVTMSRLLICLVFGVIPLFPHIMPECLVTKIAIGSILNLISWCMIGTYCVIKYFMVKTQKTGLISCFKFLLLEDIVSENHYYWFRYRIGYATIIPITYCVLLTLQYFVTFIIINSYPPNLSSLWNRVDLIITILGMIIDGILLIYTLRYTPFYYIDKLVSIYDTDRYVSWIAIYQKTLTGFLCTIIQIIFLYSHQNKLILATPVIISLALWLLISTVEYCYYQRIDQYPKRHAQYETI